MLRHMLLHEEWMALRDAAELYRVTPDTMQVWVEAGKFTAQRIGDELWLSREELISALRRPPAAQPQAQRGRR
jgi:predicted site-specific integrase-resolvase